MKSKSQVSRAAMAAVVMAVMAMSAVSAEAALQRAPVDPIQRAGGEGRMRRAVSDGVRMASAKMVAPSWMMRLWENIDYRPLLDARLRSSK